MVTRRKSGRKKSQDLTRIIEHALLSGEILANERTPGARLMNAGQLSGVWLEALRAAWKKHGTRLTKQHIADYPGSRPWGWWAFSTPKGAPPWPLFHQVEALGMRNRCKLVRGAQTDYLRKHSLFVSGEEEAAAAFDRAEDARRAKKSLDRLRGKHVFKSK